MDDLRPPGRLPGHLREQRWQRRARRATPDTAVATAERGAELVRDGSPDFLLFRRGDSWRSGIGSGRGRRFKSGESAGAPLVVSSYGDSRQRPRFELDDHFIDDDGNGREFLAIVGLAFLSYPKAPGDPDFDGTSGGAARFVSGESSDVLLEDNYIEYGEYILQNGSNFRVRRNVIYRSYHEGTCAYESDGSRDPNGNVEFRPSGIFAGRVDGLLIEENVFDENGWNPDVEEACATIYNHNMYLSGNQRVTVRANLILRASSIGIKMAAGNDAQSADIVIEDNVFAEGEIGISMGGNGDTDYRFANVMVRNNVFTDIGRSQPTTRTLTWYVGLTDNDATEVVGNYFLNQPPALGNSYGILLSGDTNRDINVRDNVFHGMSRRIIRLQETPAWSQIRFENNRVVQTNDGACMVESRQGPGTVTFAGNTYQSSAAADEWFCVDGEREDLAAWLGRTGEAMMSPPPATDPGRNLDSYAATLGLEPTLDAFAAAARAQSRHSYRLEFSAQAASRYMREGVD